MTGTPAVSNRTDGDGDTTLPYCRDALDLETAESRLAIARLLRRWLGERGVTVMEVLWTATLLRDLMRQDAVVSAACYQVARLQVSTERGSQLAGDAAMARSRQLRDLADQLAGVIAHRQTPTLDARRPGFGEAVRMLSGSAGEQIAWHATCHAVVQVMGRLPSYGTKFDALLEVAEASTQPMVLAAVDAAMAGILALEEGFQSAFIEGQDMIALLEDVLSVLAGAARLSPSAPIALRRLLALLARVEMPETRAALRRAWAGRLAQPDPLIDVRARPDDPAFPMLEELRFLVRTRRRVASIGGWFASPRLERILDAREARLTGEDRILLVVGQHKGLHKRLEAGLAMGPLMHTAPARTRLADWVSGEVHASDFEDRVRRDIHVPIDAVGVFGFLARRIARSGFPRDVVDRLLSRLAECQERHLRRERFFTRIRDMRAGDAEKGVYVLELLHQGVFVRGRCEAAARRLAAMLLTSEDEIEATFEALGGEDDAWRERCAVLLEVFRGLNASRPMEARS